MIHLNHIDTQQHHLSITPAGLSINNQQAIKVHPQIDDAFLLFTLLRKELRHSQRLQLLPVLKFI